MHETEPRQKELAALEQMTVSQLQQQYADVFGESVRSRHKQYLIRRIAWRLQANAEGGLSERALRRAEELANVADVRVTPPRGGISASPAPAPEFAPGPVRRIEIPKRAGGSRTLAVADRMDLALQRVLIAQLAPAGGVH